MMTTKARVPVIHAYYWLLQWCPRPSILSNNTYRSITSHHHRLIIALLTLWNLLDII